MTYKNIFSEVKGHSSETKPGGLQDNFEHSVAIPGTARLDVRLDVCNARTVSWG